ncbi:MAG: hypothetical protein ACK502_10760 [Alphaproteobacteria bacterium]
MQKFGLWNRVCRKGVVDMVTGGGADKQAKAAARRQAEILAQQEAVQARAKQKEDTREEDLSAQAAGLRRSVAARRRSSGQLAFAGANTGLKTTFGG